MGENTGNQTVADIGEFELIERVTAAFPSTSIVQVGPGDDAAVVAQNGPLVISTDVLVQGRHFRLDWSSAADIGTRAAAANLADIAAMGARPTALTVALVLPRETSVAWVLELADGLATEAAAAGAAVVGGDISAGDAIAISVTAVGTLEQRPPVLRSGARVGDTVGMAGRLGWASAGLTVLSRGFRSPRALTEAHRRPNPPYEAGRQAARAGASSLIDVSDGLIADLGHVAAASNVSIDIHAAELPVPEPLQAAASALGVDPLGWVLTGGDDHALIATFPAETVLPEQFRAIGRVNPRDGDIPAVTVDGEPWLGQTGFVHFT